MSIIRIITNYYYRTNFVKMEEVKQIFLLFDYNGNIPYIYYEHILLV